MKRIVVQRPSEEENDESEAREDWVGHAFTAKSREKFKRLVDAQQKIFHEACNRSTDPNVRAEFVRFRELAVFLDWLAKGK